jgi:hypothetical protein
MFCLGRFRCARDNSNGSNDTEQRIVVEVRVIVTIYTQ